MGGQDLEGGEHYPAQFSEVLTVLLDWVLQAGI
jgi:hypothetical protein